MTLNFKERFMELEKVDIFLVKTCDCSYEQHMQNVEKNFEIRTRILFFRKLY